MPDLIVRLYALPDDRPWQEQMKKQGILIRNARAWDKHQVVTWVKKAFGNLWASECDVAFSHQPAACFLATKNRQIIGFACHDTSMKNFFGPVGVVQESRGKGIGTALLHTCLHAMKKTGYAYAIIGDAGSPDFYKRAVNAHVIEGSTPGPYYDRLKKS